MWPERLSQGRPQPTSATQCGALGFVSRQATISRSLTPTPRFRLPKPPLNSTHHWLQRSARRHHAPTLELGETQTVVSVATRLNQASAWSPSPARSAVSVGSEAASVERERSGREPPTGRRERHSRGRSALLKHAPSCSGPACEQRANETRGRFAGARAAQAWPSGVSNPFETSAGTVENRPAARRGFSSMFYECRGRGGRPEGFAATYRTHWR